MSNTSLVLGMNWQPNEWPDFVDVSHEGACDYARMYVPERTCTVEYGLEYDDLLDIWTVHFSCGHIVHPFYNEVPNFCEECGARVVGHETRNMSDKFSTEGSDE